MSWPSRSPPPDCSWDPPALDPDTVDDEEDDVFHPMLDTPIVGDGDRDDFEDGICEHMLHSQMGACSWPWCSRFRAGDDATDGKTEPRPQVVPSPAANQDGQQPLPCDDDEKKVQPALHLSPVNNGDELRGHVLPSQLGDCPVPGSSRSIAVDNDEKAGPIQLPTHCGGECVSDSKPQSDKPRRKIPGHHGQVHDSLGQFMTAERNSRDRSRWTYQCETCKKVFRRAEAVLHLTESDCPRPNDGTIYKLKSLLPSLRSRRSRFARAVHRPGAVTSSVDVSSCCHRELQELDAPLPIPSFHHQGRQYHQQAEMEPDIPYCITLTHEDESHSLTLPSFHTQVHDLYDLARSTFDLYAVRRGEYYELAFELIASGGPLTNRGWCLCQLFDIAEAQVVEVVILQQRSEG